MGFLRRRFGLELLVAVLLPGSHALAVPMTAAPAAGEEMATRLNEATVRRGMNTAVAALPSLTKDLTANDTFFGKREFFAAEPHRPEYVRLGRVEDAIADRTNTSLASTHASVRVATAAASVSPNQVQDPALMVGASRGGVFGGNPRSTLGSRGLSQADLAPLPFELSAAPLPSAIVVSPASPLPAAQVRPEIQVSGTVASAATQSDSRLQASGATAASALSAEVQSDFVRTMLRRNQDFPGNARPVLPMLVDTFLLAPSGAVDQVADGAPTSPVPTVALPMTLFPAVDQAMPPTVRIFRDSPSGISMLDWPTYILQALRQMSGPEIISVIIAGGGLFGLAQLWRRRRRIE